MEVKQINIQTLALLGDAVFTLYIRKKLIELGITNPNLIQKKSVEYVSAKSQANLLEMLINNKLLTADEIDIVKRGRNNKRENHPKNTDIIIYKISTGFEALLGTLYLEDKDRLFEILSYIEVKK